MAPKYAVAALAASAGMAAAMPTDPHAEIVGGSAASAGEFPYIVSLQHSGSHFCGGALISADTVMTAGHCSVDYAAGSVTVVAGTLNWASGGTSVGVSEIVVHPDYNARTTDNDVALWHLSKSLSETSTIGYSTLPAQGSDPTAGTETTVAGWGLTSENGAVLPRKLMKVEVPIVSRTECNSDYSGAVTDGMICAAVEGGGKDSCSGDSGGPLVNSDDGVQVGIVSWGQGCAEDGYPGVYTHLGKYVSWVKANMW